MSYFDQTQFISNSDLGSLKDLMRGEGDKDLSEVYGFGSLFHGLITEPHKVDHDMMQLNEGANVLQFNKEKFEKAKAMEAAARQDSALKLLMATSKKEHEIYRRKFLIQYNDHEIEIPTRVKLDFLNKRLAIGCDLKGISCESQQQFIDSILFFDYDRQGAWYIDNANLEQFMFLGVSKKKNKFEKHQVFKFVMIKGDENYLRGKRKYSFLAFNYFFKIYNLNLQLNVPSNQGFSL